MIPLTALAALGVFAALFLLASGIRNKRSSRKTRLPPGDLGWPIVGETFSAIKEFYQQRLLKYGSIFKTSLYGSKTVVFASPEGNRLVLMSENKLVQVSYPRTVKLLLGDNALISLKGEEHRRAKSLLMAFLRPETLQKFVGRSSKVALDHLQESWENKKVISIYTSMKKFTFSLACNLFVGLNIGDEEMNRLAEDFDVLVRGLFQLPIDLPGTLFRKGKAARRRIDECIDEHIRKRRADMSRGKEEQDMLGILLTTRDENGDVLSDTAIKDSIVSLLFAGHDTSSVALTWTFKYLADNPSCIDQVVQENRMIRESQAPGAKLSWEDIRKMKYTWKAVQESMRLRAPVGGGFREALTDIEFQGYDIPKGWKLNWTAVTSTQEKYFPEADKFKPSRFDEDPLPYTYLPFGSGQRMCPGYEFAKMEILVFLHHCVLEFEWELLEPNEDFVVDPMPRPVNGLPVRVRSRV